MAALSLAALLLACSGSGGDAVAPASKPGITILPPPRSTDTVGTRVYDPLVVEYRRADGTPQSGVLIRFESLDAVPGVPSPVSPILFTFGQDGDVGYLMTTTRLTNAAGRASALYSFGRKAGTGRVRISAPDLGVAETILFEAKPGNPKRIAFSTADTVLPIGGSIPISASTVDNWGNPRDESVLLTLRGGPGASFTAGTLRNTAFGQTVIEGAFAALKDSVRVGFVPPGRFALVKAREHSSDSTRVFLVNSDLTRRRLVGGPSTTLWSDRTPAWSPTGGRLVVQMGDHFPRLFFVDTATGDTTRAIPYTTPTISERVATYSPDGAWIYYAVTQSGQDERLWRIRADGTEAKLVGLPGDWFDMDSSPSISPDGTRLVYWTNRISRNTANPTLMTIRIATSDTTSLNARGLNPRWSPVGTEILYTDSGALKLMRPDGTGQRTIGVQTGYGGYPAWSPDGQYAVASHVGGLQMIHVASGEIVYYPRTTIGLGQVAWRP